MAKTYVFLGRLMKNEMATDGRRLTQRQVDIMHFKIRFDYELNDVLGCDLFKFCLVTFVNLRVLFFGHIV